MLLNAGETFYHVAGSAGYRDTELVYLKMIECPRGNPLSSARTYSTVLVPAIAGGAIPKVSVRGMT